MAQHVHVAERRGREYIGVRTEVGTLEMVDDVGDGEEKAEEEEERCAVDKVHVRMHRRTEYRKVLQRHVERKRAARLGVFEQLLPCMLQRTVQQHLWLIHELLPPRIVVLHEAIDGGARDAAARHSLQRDHCALLARRLLLRHCSKWVDSSPPRRQQRGPPAGGTCLRRGCGRRAALSCRRAVQALQLAPLVPGGTEPLQLLYGRRRRRSEGERRRRQRLEGSRRHR
mmetsp:Transcript_3164/g.10608  ORF Transcript_3164/g.10608 Transcript_3164/m.10608 type:complete len:227 (+) Transcript_3164:2362-3042(+)